MRLLTRRNGSARCRLRSLGSAHWWATPQQVTLIAAAELPLGCAALPLEEVAAATAR